MGRLKKTVAGVVVAAGLIGFAAPTASASDVPCEAVFGEYVCNQLSATGDFVDQTVANAGGAVAEWRKRVADTADGVWDTVYCIISGACPLT